MPNSYANIWRDGLWQQNAAMVRLLGLCPLLAMSHSVTTALSLSLATTLALVLSNSLVSLLRGQLSGEIRLVAFVIVIATAVTCVELLLRALAYELSLALGLFLPLIASNCLILARAEAFAIRRKPLAAALDGLAYGLGLSLVMIGLGGVRELLGRGTLLHQINLILPGAGDWQLTLIPAYPGFLLALMPAGAFLILGFMVAGKKYLELRKQQHASGILGPMERRTS